MMKVYKAVHERENKCKIVNAPTQIHRMVTPKMMLPLIDDKLQEEFKETEARE